MTFVPSVKAGLHVSFIKQTLDIFWGGLSFCICIQIYKLLLVNHDSWFTGEEVTAKITASAPTRDPSATTDSLMMGTDASVRHILQLLCRSVKRYSVMPPGPAARFGASLTSWPNEELQQWRPSRDAIEPKKHFPCTQSWENKRL